MARDKHRTKTSEDRLIELCPRALEVLKRQLALRARLHLAGRISHDVLFFDGDGKPWHDLQTPWKHWKRTLDGLNCRYREPYNARHISVSWNLMIGKTRCGWPSSTATACRRCWMPMRRERTGRRRPISRPSNVRWKRARRDRHWSRTSSFPW